MSIVPYHNQAANTSEVQEIERQESPLEKALARLSEKERLMVLVYLQTGDAVQAVKAAGVNGHVTMAQAMSAMRVGRIGEAVEAGFGAGEMSRGEVLGHVGRIARGPQHLITVTDDGYPRLDWKAARDHNELGLIKKLKYKDGMPEVEFYDRLAALELAGRSHGVFRDKVEVTSTVTHGVDPSVSKAVMARALSNPETLDKLLALRDAVANNGQAVDVQVSAPVTGEPQ